MRDTFIFYSSFYEAIKDLPNEIRLEVYEAIINYSLKRVETAITPLAKTLFILIKPQLDANYKRYRVGKQNGQKGAQYGVLGGRPITPKKPLSNPQVTPKKPSNNNKNNNKNKNENVEEIVDNLQQFIINKEKYIAEAYSLHADKNCNKAFEDFTNYWLTNKKAKDISDFRLKFLIWVNDDKFNQYSAESEEEYLDPSLDPNNF